MRSELTTCWRLAVSRSPWRSIPPMILALLVLQTPAANAQMASLTQQSATLNGTLTLTLTAQGFRPNHIAVHPGQVALLIVNRSRLQNVTVNVTQDGVSGVQLASQHTASTRDIWHFVSVQSGSYHVTVAEQPAWTCTLNVVSK